jgi:hypothetical protein
MMRSEAQKPRLLKLLLDEYLPFTMLPKRTYLLYSLANTTNIATSELQEQWPNAQLVILWLSSYQIALAL